MEIFSKHSLTNSSNDSQRKQNKKEHTRKNRQFAKFSQKDLLVKIFKVSIERVLELLTE